MFGYDQKHSTHLKSRLQGNHLEVEHQGGVGFHLPQLSARDATPQQARMTGCPPSAGTSTNTAGTTRVVDDLENEVHRPLTVNTDTVHVTAGDSRPLSPFCGL